VLQYKKMKFRNAWPWRSTTPSNSGFQKVVTSFPCVLYNPNGDNMTITTANGTRYSFDRLRLGAAWRNSMSITMSTYRAGSLTSSGTYTTATTFQYVIQRSFCTNIDTMTFQAQGGTPNINLPENGTQLVIDNLCISFGH
jgi:hypothetical protein